MSCASIKLLKNKRKRGEEWEKLVKNKTLEHSFAS